MGTVGQVAAVAPRSPARRNTVFDAYPLRPGGAHEFPPLGRTVSNRRLDSAEEWQNDQSEDDESSDDEWHRSNANGDSTEKSSSMRDVSDSNLSPRRRMLFSNSGKFQGEIYEAKARSKVFSVLKHRGKVASKPVNNPVVKNASKAATFTAEDIVLTGTLRKEGSWRRNWKTRFFILRQDVPSLCYFTSEEKLELLGEIAITSETLVLDQSSGGKPPFRFQLRTESKRLLLEAESKDLQQQWINACQDLIDRIRSVKFTGSMTNLSSSQCRFTMPERPQTSTPVSKKSTPKRSSMITTGSKKPDLSTIPGSGPVELPDDIDKENRFLAQNKDLDTQTLQALENSAYSSAEESEDPSEGSTGLQVPPFSSMDNVLSDVAIINTQLAEGVRRRSETQRLLDQEHTEPYDMTIFVAFGKKNRFARGEGSKDKAGCFVTVEGYSQELKAFVTLGNTEVIRLSAAANAAASAVSEDDNYVAFPATPGEIPPGCFPFTVVLTSALDKYDQLRMTLHKCPLNQGVTGNLTTIGIGRCVLTENVLSSEPTVLTIMERGGVNPNRSSVDRSQKPSNGALMLKVDKTGVQLIVQVLPSISSQEALPTTGVDMAVSKYLLPTASQVRRRRASSTHEEARSSHAKTLLDNGSFLTDDDSSPVSNLRFVATAEVLRTPRSTFSFPLAYLDFLEARALERIRRIQKEVATSGKNVRHEASVLNEFELECLRKKQQEYVKQRQFLVNQEKRLLDEGLDGRNFIAAQQLDLNPNKDKHEDELMAPFKRSTFRNREMWQMLPTNMQNQYLCAPHPDWRGSSYKDMGDAEHMSDNFVWHTMTMGCPAAHTKGFANGGYRKLEQTLQASRQQRTSPSDEESYSLREGRSSASSGSSTNAADRGRRSGGTKPRVSNTSTSIEEMLTALKTRLEMSDRLEIISSQILSSAIACILSSLDLASLGSGRHALQFEYATKLGYLVHYESLLSTQGKETGMLEDFVAATSWLRNVFVCFSRAGNAGSYFVVSEYSGATDTSSDDASGSSRCLLVTIGVTAHHLNALPKDLAEGRAFRIRSVLFSQGVNEKQSLVHAYKSSSVRVQERVNQENLVELKQIFREYQKLQVDSDQPPPISRYSVDALGELLAQIEKHVTSTSNQFKKNVALLTDTSDFCREIGGARVTCCKSGKDRTAMSVTLEQARICCGEMQATEGTRICSTMRLFGVRRKNVYSNTRATKFAFNEVQRKMLPECYKPPVGTYKSGKT